jgi:hypothetical protein
MESMEPKTDQQAPEVVEPEQEKYVPRPKWQIAMAWIGLVIMAIGIALYYYYIATKY